MAAAPRDRDSGYRPAVAAASFLRVLDQALHPAHRRPPTCQRRDQRPPLERSGRGFGEGQDAGDQARGRHTADTPCRQPSYSCVMRTVTTPPSSKKIRAHLPLESGRSPGFARPGAVTAAPSPRRGKGIRKRSASRLPTPAIDPRERACYRSGVAAETGKVGVVEWSRGLTPGKTVRQVSIAWAVSVIPSTSTGARPLRPWRAPNGTRWPHIGIT